MLQSNNSHAPAINERKDFSSDLTKSTLSEIVPIVQKDDNLLVSAILLYRKLKISTKYSMWFQRRIEEYGFEKNNDYFPDLGSKKGGRGNFSTDYLLTRTHLVVLILKLCKN